MDLSGVGNTALYSTSTVRPSERGAPAAPEKLNTHPHPDSATKAPPSTNRADGSLISDSNALQRGEKTSANTEDKKSAVQSFSPEELQEIEKLEARDQEVRDHERAHSSVGGQYTGAPNLEYTRGPDGRLYATSGDVSVDTSSVSGDPQATIDKMRVVIRAAMAPADPSSQDHRVAAKARALLAEAQAELATQRTDDEDSDSDAVDNSGAPTSLKSGDSSEAVVDAGAADGASSETLESAVQGLRPGVPFISSHLEMERRLVETGVFTKVFPEGSLIRQQA